jgi:hypothetical protein
MSRHEKDDTNAAQASATPDPPDTDRRKFVKGGLVSAPLVLTLASRPVLGNARTVVTSGNSANSGATLQK